MIGVCFFIFLCGRGFQNERKRTSPTGEFVRRDEDRLFKADVPHLDKLPLDFC